MRGIFISWWAVLAALLGLPVGALSQPGSVDLSFVPHLNDGAQVYAVALQTNGQILIGGSFYFVDDQLVLNIARLNPDGSLDPSFNPGYAAAYGYVNAVVVQPDGKVLVGGSLSTSSGTPLNLVRLNGDGTVDGTFHPSLTVDNAVNAIVLQKDGKILLGGSFFTVDGLVRTSIARLNPGGTLDVGFDACVASSAGAGATAVAVQSDGKVLASGNFTFSIGSAVRDGIARLKTNGDLDISFANVAQPAIPDGTTAYTFVARTNGKAILGGNFSGYRNPSSTLSPGVVQLTTSGTFDATFNTGTGIDFYNGNTVYAMALQADGKLLLGGNFTYYNDTTRYGVARVNLDGNLDVAFDPGFGPNNSVGAFAIQKDGQILVVGRFSSFNGQPRTGVARLNGDHPPSRLGPPVALGNGQYRMMFQGESQAHYSLQASSNFLSWVSITNFTASGATMLLTDPVVNAGPKRFYRAVTTP